MPSLAKKFSRIFGIGRAALRMAGVVLLTALGWLGAMWCAALEDWRHGERATPIERELRAVWWTELAAGGFVLGVLGWLVMSIVRHS